jgi:hypothetical protein
MAHGFRVRDSALPDVLALAASSHHCGCCCRRTICRRNVEADEDDRHHGRTDAVVGNADNDDGKQPVWTQDNRIELRAPTKSVRSGCH